jgi:Mor family transcriptional regulator
MKAGALNDVIDDGVTLRHDMTCILIECHRDSGMHGIFHPLATSEQVERLAEMMALRLAPMIGGRYIPKRDERVARDQAVWKRFNGRNHAEVMREFSISRRLLYSILARRRSGAS